MDKPPKQITIRAHNNGLRQIITTCLANASTCHRLIETEDRKGIHDAVDAGYHEMMEVKKREGALEKAYIAIADRMAELVVPPLKIEYSNKAGTYIARTAVKRTITVYE